MLAVLYSMLHKGGLQMLFSFFLVTYTTVQNLNLGHAQESAWIRVTKNNKVETYQSGKM